MPGPAASRNLRGRETMPRPTQQRATALTARTNRKKPRAESRAARPRVEPLEAGEWRQQRDESAGNIEVAKSELALWRL